MSGPVLGQRGFVSWAVVGDVLDTSKPASRVAASIERQGRILYRVSPSLDAKDVSPEQRVYKKFADLPPFSVYAVNLCVNYRIGMMVLDEMKKRGISYCFLQPGADHEDLCKKADAMDIVYQQGCMIVESLIELDEDEQRMVEERKQEDKQRLADEKKGAKSTCTCTIL